MSYPNTRDCQHGRKRGSCQECDDSQEIKQLDATISELKKELNKTKSSWYSSNKRIADLEKERGTLNARLKEYADTYFTCKCRPSEVEAHNLEQQAKGVELFIKSEAESLQKAPWFKDSQPTLEYLYDADFGLSTCSSGLEFAEFLRNQAKALNESK